MTNIKKRILKRIEELKGIKDNSISRATKSKYNFVITELKDLLEDEN